MAREHDARIHEDAIAWHVRLAASEDADWEQFVRWLEADPRHNAAYEAVADADRRLDPIVDIAPVVAGAPAFPAANDEAPASPPRRWRLAALAASLALVAGGALWTYRHADARYTVMTAPGETRQIALADGTRIALNGATEIVLDKRDPRRAELKSGEVQLTVRHDEAKPFSLAVDGQRIVDVGTVFNVLKSAHALRLEVAEGAVRFEDGEVHLRLNAGDTLVASGNAITEGTRPVAAIGSWTQGRLVYRDRPLVDVVADLERARGVAIELGPDLSGRLFTGVIQLNGDDESVRKRFEQLLELKVSKTPDGWSISG